MIPELVPEFWSIDPFASDPLAQVTIDYPFWLKPIKAFYSKLGFKMENYEQFHAAIKATREAIHHFGDPFNDALAYVDLPAEIREANGNTRGA